MEHLIDIEELERKTNEDVPFLDSFGEPQRFPLNNTEVLEFDNWIRKNKEYLLPRLPEKFKDEKWKLKVERLRQIERNIEEEVQSERFQTSFKNGAIAFLIMFVIVALYAIWKILSLFVFGNISF